MKCLKTFSIQWMLILAILSATHIAVRAEDAGAGNNTTPLEIKVGEDGPKISTTFNILISMTLLAILPSILIMTTSFMRIIIVLGFLRNALSVQQTPPNIVLIGIALFLTLFIMTPVFNRMNQDAIGPYTKGDINQQQAFERGLKPLREFMGKQTRKKDLSLMLELSHAEAPRDFNDIPTTSLIPAFMLSELRTAFQMGFLLFLPFLVIDLVVSATLMSLGMMMLPPSTFSLPLKLLLFVLADGWQLIVKSLVASFGM